MQRVLRVVTGAFALSLVAVAGCASSGMGSGGGMLSAAESQVEGAAVSQIAQRVGISADVAQVAVTTAKSAFSGSSKTASDKASAAQQGAQAATQQASEQGQPLSG